MSDNLHNIEITALSCSINCLMIDRKFVNKTIFNQIPVIAPFYVFNDNSLAYYPELQFIGKVINSPSKVFLENPRENGQHWFENSLWLIFICGENIYKYPVDSKEFYQIHNSFEWGENTQYYRIDYTSNLGSKFDDICKKMIDKEFSKAKQIYIGKPF